VSFEEQAQMSTDAATAKKLIKEVNPGAKSAADKVLILEQIMKTPEGFRRLGEEYIRPRFTNVLPPCDPAYQQFYSMYFGGSVGTYGAVAPVAAPLQYTAPAPRPAAALTLASRPPAYAAPAAPAPVVVDPLQDIINSLRKVVLDTTGQIEPARVQLLSQLLPMLAELDDDYLVGSIQHAQQKLDTLGPAEEAVPAPVAAPLGPPPRAVYVPTGQSDNEEEEEEEEEYSDEDDEGGDLDE
jgi:hypothetical protein